MATVKQTAERLGVSPSAVYAWVRNGDLKAEYSGLKPSPVKRTRNYQGRIDIPEEQIAALLAQFAAAAQADLAQAA
jgi:predicted site-specific integrase-resolvase